MKLLESPIEQIIKEFEIFYSNIKAVIPNTDKCKDLEILLKKTDDFYKGKINLEDLHNCLKITYEIINCPANVEGRCEKIRELLGQYKNSLDKAKEKISKNKEQIFSLQDLRRMIREELSELEKGNGANFKNFYSLKENPDNIENIEERLTHYIVYQARMLSEPKINLGAAENIIEDVKAMRESLNSDVFKKYELPLIYLETAQHIKTKYNLSTQVKITSKVKK